VASELTEIRKGEVTVTTDERGPVPPDAMVQMYSGSPHAEQYVTLGNHLLAFLIEQGKLQPHHKVLDVGCGIGLAARPLIKFLSGPGSYDGFDVMSEPVEWCKTQYRDFPRFRFEHADIYNKHYNPNSRLLARDYEFPYAAGAFDMVILTSVFTHLLPDDMEHYLAEIARVMKPGGKCFITYFLLNAESRGQIDRWLKEHPDLADRGTPGGLGFRWEYGSQCRLYDKDVPETAVAYSEDWVMGQYADKALAIEKVEYGEWCRRSFQPGWQDHILAVKG
jgi:SAM-dependent methyltransferase